MTTGEMKMGDEEIAAMVASAREAGAIEGALFERDKWEKFAQIEREYQAMFKELEARATGAEQMQKLLATEREEARETIKDLEGEIGIRALATRAQKDRAEAAERQLAEARREMAEFRALCDQLFHRLPQGEGQWSEGAIETFAELSRLTYRHGKKGCTEARALLSGKTTPS